MNYHAYEFAHVLMSPLRWAAKGSKFWAQSPFNPMAETLAMKNIAAGLEVFEGVTRRYGKPEFNLDTTIIDGEEVAIEERVVASKPFCKLLHFVRGEVLVAKRNDPKVLVIAPMSGHYATLLRGTVAAMLPEHDVYVTDWMDARDVPLYEGGFDLDDFIDYIIEFIQAIGPGTNVIAVCQPAVPALAAIALMAARGDPMQPDSLTLMGGPIDTRRNPTAVNDLAQKRSLSWFEQNVISYVPWPNPGCMRRVYPGFLQLTGFMTMNLERHTTAHVELFNDLVKGDNDSVVHHRKFYDEYLSVMDLDAQFYLQTVKVVFQDHDLPDGRMSHRGQPIDCSKIRKTALLTVEGENDDICGIGQTRAAHDLCTNIPERKKFHYMQPKVGHYGVFNGRRWRNEIQPRIRDVIRAVRELRKTGSTKALEALSDHAVATVEPATVEPGHAAAATAAAAAARSASTKPAKPSRGPLEIPQIKPAKNDAAS